MNWHIFAFCCLYSTEVPPVNASCDFGDGSILAHVEGKNCSGSDHQRSSIKLCGSKMNFRGALLDGRICFADRRGDLGKTVQI